MDITQLKENIDCLAESLQNRDRRLLNARLKGLVSAFPFNEYEYLLMLFLDREIIKFDHYEKLRDEYVFDLRSYLKYKGLAK